MNPHQVTADFEQALCEYTGAPYAVVVNSCTMALTLAMAWCLRAHQSDIVPYRYEVQVPKRTYVSVPMAVIHAGGIPVFYDLAWVGHYRLKPLPVYDCARMFTGGMYNRFQGSFACVSFHASKILGDTQGGAILHDSPSADVWLRKARFDGRAAGVAPKDDKDIIVGWHCYISPDVSARLLNKLHFLPRDNAPLPNDDYPDLSTLECFQ